MPRMHRIECIVVAALLAACGRGTPVGRGGHDRRRGTGSSTAASRPSGELASSRTFNSLLGNFQFAVPDVWEQRYTATERAKAPEYPGTKTVTEFLFLPMSGGTPPALLTILQYSEKRLEGYRCGARQAIRVRWSPKAAGACSSRSVAGLQSLPCGQ